MSHEFGFVRVSAAVPRVTVADPAANASAMLALLEDLADSDIVLFPELSLSAYTCERLFHQEALLDACEKELTKILHETRARQQLIIIGMPLRFGSALYNCAVAINAGEVVGVVPKQYIPNYNEFYEARWFAAANAELPENIPIADQFAPFGTQLLFTNNSVGAELVLHVEVCEALWMPIPPSSLAALAGANLLCNPSASPETVGKATYRQNLVTGQSGRCIAGYAYCGAGPTESTSDLVFGGHSMIAEAGHMLSESSRVGDSEVTNRASYVITADIDIQKLQTERRTTTTYQTNVPADLNKQYRRLPFELSKSERAWIRHVDALPFVPGDTAELETRCTEVFGIQTCALAKRVEQLGSSPKLVIGVSGGLDSTLALLVAVKTCDMLSIPRKNITAVTMPGFGTSERSFTNAKALIKQLDTTLVEIDIRQDCLNEFVQLNEAIGYKPFGQLNIDKSTSLDEFSKAIESIEAEDAKDLTFENVQARRRTEYLMNMGFVLGTGDMSELWLGWCTYNADHQSMYNVNCSVPKTLVKALVSYVAHTAMDDATRKTLESICDTEISPELLPENPNTGEIQSTEDTIGPYELHDFFMFNMARFGFSPDKVKFLASKASGFSRDYTSKEIEQWLTLNIKRAFSQQYKRDDVPNGPKVGSLSLSPRGDWRMPSDASCIAWLHSLK